MRLVLPLFSWARLVRGRLGGVSAGASIPHRQGDKRRGFGLSNDRRIPRDYTYISDIIHGIVQSIDRCQGYHIYNLGESNVISLKKLIALIEKHLGKKARIERLPFQPGDVPITYADVSLPKKELAYQPKVHIETGVKKFVEWYLENKVA